MIATKIGITNLNGSKFEIMADYSTITHSIYGFLTEEIEMDDEQAKAELKEAFDIALEPEDVHADADTLGNLVVDILETVLKDLKGELSEESEGK